MKFYARTDTAVRMLLFLAREDVSKADGETIARSIGAYIFEIENLLPCLLEFGFVRESEGQYSLSVHPSRIHLYDIVRAAQGDIALLSCLAPDRFCPSESQDHCPFRTCCIELQGTIIAYLKSKTLRSLLEQEADARA